MRNMNHPLNSSQFCIAVSSKDTNYDLCYITQRIDPFFQL